MKIRSTAHIIILCTLVSSFAKAQAVFTDVQYLDINKFSAASLLHADMWYDPGSYKPACEFPKGSGKHAGYVSALWMIGNDGLGSDFLSAQQYRIGSKTDYWPGPLDASGSCNYPTSQKWARVWKVSHYDITAFKALTSRTVSTVPKDILEWPAKGSLYARGAAGAMLSIPDQMAPFVDTDGDGNYDPLKGDYPKIKGDQMLWWIFNDNGATHDATSGTPFKVEYRCYAYAYSRGGASDNIIFYEYDMYNRSAVRYLDFRFGFYTDPDLGYPFDDYIAFDSSHRMGIVYNSSIPDGPNGLNSYGMHPPLVAFGFIEMPGDTYPGGMQPAGSFNYFGGSVGSLRDPKTVAEYKNYMYGKDADGNPFYFGSYAYPITKGAIQCDSNHPSNDKRFLMTTRNYNFQPGTSTKVAMVLMATDTTGNACPVINFKPLTDLADTAWQLYYNPLPPLSVKEIAALDQKLRVYPNPASGTLFIDSYTGKELKAAQLKVYDINGREVNVIAEQSKRQVKMDISALAAGVYSLVYTDGELKATQQFVKE